MSESRGMCDYLSCKKEAESPALFDFDFLGIRGLDKNSKFCFDHLSVLRKRIKRFREREAQARQFPVSYGNWVRPPAAELKDFVKELADEHPVRKAYRRIEFFRRKLLDSPARRDSDALALALDEIMRALGPRGRRGQIAKAWVGLQLAIQESRRRRWNARRTAEWVEVVAFYGGLCAYCEETSWAHVDHIVPLARGGDDGIWNAVPACQLCNQRKCDSLGWTPRRKHRLLVQENQSQESYAVDKTA